MSAEKLDDVMEALGEVRLVTGAYEGLMDGAYETKLVGRGEQDQGGGGDTESSGKEKGKRIRIAGGKHWDVILHVLPKGA